MAAFEQRAREEIDRLLLAAGWAVQDMAAVNLHVARGVSLPATWSLRGVDPVKCVPS